MRGAERGASVVAYVGLGSNLADPRGQVRGALDELARLPGCILCARSSLYLTRPLGPVAQPDYVNAVAALATTRTAPDLLAALQGIEQAHGRVRGGLRWGPRTLDLDLLLFGEVKLSMPSLVVPHPELTRRAFVLVPLAEIAPLGLRIPGQGHLAAALATLGDPGGIERITD